jgi:hypothetical protein
MAADRLGQTAASKMDLGLQQYIAGFADSVFVPKDISKCSECKIVRIP